MSEDEKVEIPVLEAPDVENLDDLPYDLFQKRGYVRATLVRGPFKFKSKKYEEGGYLVYVPGEDPQIIETAEFEADYVLTSPNKVIS